MDLIRQWARSFCVAPLYDTGFSEAWMSSGITDPDTDVLRALSFVEGYALACRLACTYPSPAWQRADWLVIACGVLYAKVKHGASTDEIRGLLDTYTRVLTELACQTGA